MSANAQKALAFAPYAPEQQIREGALAGPLHTLLAEDPRKASKLKKQFRDIPLSQNPEHLISAETFTETLARAERLSNESGLVLRSAVSQELGELGLFGKAAIYAETLWESLLSIQAGIAYFQGSEAIQFQLKNGTCRVLYTQPFKNFEGSKLDAQYTMGLLYNVLNQVECNAEANIRIGYSGANSSHFAAFPGAVQIKNTPGAYFEFNDLLLKCPMKRSNALLSAVSSGAIGEMDFNADTSPEIPELLHLIQHASVKSGFTTMPIVAVADLLDIPVRSLQAILKSEESSFAQIRDRVLHEIARRDLQEGYSIFEVSQNLGFSHRQSFSEAFSRWEGTAPSEFASRNIP